MTYFSKKAVRRLVEVSLLFGAIALFLFYYLPMKEEDVRLGTGIAERMESADGTFRRGLSQCPAGHPLSTNGRDSRLARGLNFPNWRVKNPDLKPDDDLLGKLFSEGFTHIRLPIEPVMVMEPFASPEEINQYMSELEGMLGRLTGMGYAVSIDMHPSSAVIAELYERNHELAFKLLTQAWEGLASKLKNWPFDDVYFDLLNEPTDHGQWWPAAQVLVSRLNSIAPGRRLIVGPGIWQRYEPLLQSQPLNGNDLIYAIHFYSPMVFTHQSMNWDEGSSLSAISNVPFPASINHPSVMNQIIQLKSAGKSKAAEELSKAYEEPWNSERIGKIFKQVGQWASAHNVAVIVNEFGVLDFTVGMEDRGRWIRAVREGAELACVGWAYWDVGPDGFGLIDDKTRNVTPYAIDALLH
ncbi:glycoside hydrolase family 5 protein [Cohaesibacter haloalkalitolerans]|uniref:glycoside hydrolase family 5 protein n=1 Tax=Cohaesibacter haloalkalitolerans TaxID=1162980 RepID=UPI0013C4DD2B|nr:cellulase family glycosylhydrolase [Cohaesibacter haloalkalitolerans]